MNILIINCGSSSLKFQLLAMEQEQRIAKGLCERIGIEGSRFVYTKTGSAKETLEIPIPDHDRAIELVLQLLTDPEKGVVSSLKEIGAVGHRVVHGGERFAGAALITESVLEEIEQCSELAPLHNPANLTGIRACRRLMPDTPMAAVFDTAFHQTMPEEAYLYGIPYSYYQKYQIRRYGFHGTSHAYVSKRAAALLGRPYESLKLIVCHLGNGASVSAVKHGICIDTSMGMTPLEGLIMGTRSGDVDPAVLEVIAHKEGKSIDELIELLNKQSGVLGLSEGLSSDFRDIEVSYEKGEERGKRSLKAFTYRVAKYIGAYAAAMNGADAVCFTAGVGENSPLIRHMICSYLGYLGTELDEAENEKGAQERIISCNQQGLQALVIPTNEELAIARETRRLTEKLF